MQADWKVVVIDAEDRLGWGNQLTLPNTRALLDSCAAPLDFPAYSFPFIWIPFLIGWCRIYFLNYLQMGQ